MTNYFVYRGAIENLSRVLKSVKSENLLVFTGKKSYETIKAVVEPHLEDYKTTYINDFSTNPKMEEVENALSIYGNAYDTIVAIGGGSVMDFAKLYKYKINKQIPLIAIPTTAGTGAEATKFAVVYIEGKKHSVEDDLILPNFAIVDSQFIENAPKSVKLTCALDAFCQAIESFWSVNSTSESLEYAKESLILCKNNLCEYVNNETKENAENMAKASFLAGRAINISKTTAAHALSYKFTSKYGITHGLAVALSIANLTKYNNYVDETSCNDKRGADFVKNQMKNLFEILNIKDPNSYFQNLFEVIGFNPDLKTLGVENISEIIDSVDLNRLKNNPKQLTRNELEHIFDNV